MPKKLVIKKDKVWDYKSGKEDKLAEQVKKDEDICFTKFEMAKYLIDLIKFKDGDEVMNTSFGKGAFYNQLPKNTKNYYCEINEDKDYLKQDKMVDITLDNPPFVPRPLFWEFHVKAMQSTRREIYWLINVAGLDVFTNKRITQMDEMGWYVNGLHIVNDKRWRGRYVWIKITKEDNGFWGFCNKTF